MQNSDLNSIRETQINYPEVFNKSYYIIEREKDGAIKCVHAYGVEPKPGFDYIKVADGKIFLDGRSYLNDVIMLLGYSDKDEVLDYLVTMAKMNDQSHNVTKVSTFEILDLKKMY